jgi:DNA repair protein RecN (Recombination protein N)
MYLWYSSATPARKFKRVYEEALLLELRVENYAIIDHVVVEFASGLNLLTGETGAGKSILIDALGLVLGGRASSDVVRHGAEKAIVSGVFSNPTRDISPLLQAVGLDCEADELILRREITTNGKGRVFINDQPATVALLKQLAPYLGAVHAQNESLLTFGGTEKLALLDRFAAIELDDLAALFEQQKELRQRIADLERNEQDKLRLLDLWSFQKTEIESARLQAGEDAKLEAEKRVLANAEKLYGAAMAAHELLYEAETSAAASIRNAQRHVEELTRYDEKFRETVNALTSARIAIEDAGSALADYAQGIDASPERLAQIESRLALLDRLKRKYGATVDDAIAFGADVSERISEIENRDEVLADLRKQLAAAAEKYLAAAREISIKRKTVAKELQRMVGTEVNDLAMKARFQVEVTSAENLENWSPTGIDAVEFLIATNVGEPTRPLEQIASGGELSRVMLALKLAVEAGGAKGARESANKRPTPGSNPRMLVFDEIDTGIGGRAAEAVGRKLKMLARTEQVLCITHLPQIASFADHHLLIEKKQLAGRTKTTVRQLDARERREELARMMSGAEVTQSSMQHAEQMLKANA